jgi:membrane protein DedA with SNARE-associated domain
VGEFAHFQPVSKTGTTAERPKSMTAFFAAIVEFVSVHPHFAYGAVFLLALSEAMPIIGTAVPGSTLILGISALAPHGIIELWPLLIAAILGAIAGDALSFWLGHRYHQEILLRWPLNRYAQLVSHSETLFRRYGGFNRLSSRNGWGDCVLA